MIRTNNADLDAVIEALQVQRNEALDALAVLSGKLRTQEALTKDLQAKLDEALKPKETT